MKLYFAGSENIKYLSILLREKAKNLLFSYFYISKKKVNLLSISKDKFVNGNIFLDSSGFSAFTVKALIDINKYCDYIHQNKNILTVYANLDVIGDGEASLKNLNYMESQGLNPLPVFHYGEDWSLLDEYIKKYNYFAIGGTVQLKKDKKVMYKFLDNCFSRVNQKIKIHGFGVTAIDLLKRYPFYSVDSSTWISTSIYGGIFNPLNYNGNKLIYINPHIKKNADYTLMNYTDKSKEHRNTYGRVSRNVIEFIKFEKYLTELWRLRGVVWND